MRIKLMLAVVVFVVLAPAFVSQAQFFRAKDPGVRGGAAGAGGMIPGLTAGQQAYFIAGQAEFSDVEGVADGLGPRFNLDSCKGCHVQPDVGGTSPAVNPQLAVATAYGARNRIPSFLSVNGPIREARFLFNPDGSRDGGVHGLFVITGRRDESGDASGCTAVQEDFEKQVINHNIAFRIPTPTFGVGLIEMIPDATIRANLQANSSQKIPLGIRSKFNYFNVSGTANNNGNDGTITRFGWKAQEQAAAALRRRGLQRGDGHHQRAVPERGRRESDLPVRDVAQRLHGHRKPGSGRRHERHWEVRLLHAVPGPAHAGDPVPVEERRIRER